MPPTPDELRSRLEAFAAKWRDFAGTEKSVDKPFLTELLHCYGTDWHAAGVRFEHKLPKGGFIDMLWPGVCIVEMKGPKDAAKLTELYHGQAFPYWSISGTPERSSTSPFRRTDRGRVAYHSRTRPLSRSSMSIWSAPA